MLDVHLGVILVLAVGLPAAYGQGIDIDIEDNEPCIFGQTSAIDLLRECNPRDNFMQWVTMPWEWVTGGYFTMFLVMIMIGITWIKYHQVVYPMFIGLMYLPVAYWFFPAQFISFAIVMMFVGIAALVWYAYVRQTR